MGAEPHPATALVDSGVEAYAFETLVRDGSLPLLAPMSEVAAAAVGEAAPAAGLVIGAALIPGACAPLVLQKHHVEAMHPGSVVVVLAIDQGGCTETAPPTSLSAPTFVHAGVLHYCVTNVPGQYPRTASRALSAAVAPCLRRLALDPADPSLNGALNVSQGRVVHPVVAALSATTSSQEGSV